MAPSFLNYPTKKTKPIQFLYSANALYKPEYTVPNVQKKKVYFVQSAEWVHRLVLFFFHLFSVHRWRPILGGYGSYCGFTAEENSLVDDVDDGLFTQWLGFYYTGFLHFAKCNFVIRDLTCVFCLRWSDGHRHLWFALDPCLALPINAICLSN